MEAAVLGRGAIVPPFPQILALQLQFVTMIMIIHQW